MTATDARPPSPPVGGGRAPLSPPRPSRFQGLLLPGSEPISIRLGVADWVQPDKRHGRRVRAIANAALDARYAANRGRADNRLINIAARSTEDEILDSRHVFEHLLRASQLLSRQGVEVVDRRRIARYSTIYALVIFQAVTATAVLLARHEIAGAAIFAAAVVVLVFLFGMLRGWREGYIQSAWAAAQQEVSDVDLVAEDAAASAREEAAAMLPAPVPPCELVIDLPDALAGEGYLYVIEFSTGVVKVGQTVDPRRRLPEHRRDADTFKVAIVNFWISPRHWNYLDNEIDLINRCMQVSTRARREYFRDVSFSSAVSFASELTYYTQEGVSDEHVKH